MSEERSLNFIEEIIEEDLKNGKHQSGVHTRFPPEPNGYLHIGHAKAITINFELAKKYGGKTNLRFDDTNPVTEDTEYVESIKKDINWLGYQWHGEALYASDYFEDLFQYAIRLINKGLAYVDDSSPEEIAAMKKSPSEPGINSPYRERSIDENLSLFHSMRAGKFEDGSRVLRAKIDMSSPNMHMRDPVLYRIKHAQHHRTGDTWCIYPMYDFAHGQSDSIENITHSLCSLEFRHHRPLYDWFIAQLEIFPSRQIEFARMNVTYMITSKRKLLKLVQDGIVKGWDDPRMPTLSGLRRRGYPPAAIRKFCEKAGVAKRDNLIEIELLESCVRDELNQSALRVMVVENPVKISITNYGDGEEWVSAENNPERTEDGTRQIPFCSQIFIDANDFMENPPPKYFRLAPNQMVRLKHAYIIKCNEVIKDDTGKVTELKCIYFPESKSGQDTSGLKVKGTVHWVSAKHGKPCILHNYDKLFTDPTPASHEDADVFDFINPNSLMVSSGIMEPWLADRITNPTANKNFQFLRMGYYTLDESSSENEIVFNKTVGLKESWK